MENERDGNQIAVPLLYQNDAQCLPRPAPPPLVRPPPPEPLPKDREPPPEDRKPPDEREPEDREPPEERKPPEERVRPLRMPQSSMSLFREDRRDVGV